MKEIFTIYLKRAKTSETIRISLADEEHSYVIGRSKECDCTISGNPMISRQHIEITIKDGKLYVGDLGSKFLTFLDDEQVTEPVLLKDSQILKLADELFTVEFAVPGSCETIRSEQNAPSCPICHSAINENDKFCPECGSFIG